MRRTDLETGNGQTLLLRILLFTITLGGIPVGSTTIASLRQLVELQLG